MGYQVKWVEEHLGVTRKALRCYEAAGILPQNKNRAYRSYDDDDIKQIWTIRVLQGMGFTIKEIANLVHDEKADLDQAITKKIEDLKLEILEKERHLGYAEQIKLLGRFPIFPKELGKITYQEFSENALANWNARNDPEFIAIMEIQKILNTPQEEWEHTKLGSLLFQLLSGANPEAYEDAIVASSLISAIIDRRNLGFTHPEVQLLVKVLYEALLKEDPEIGEVDIKSFIRVFSSNFVAGDIAEIQKKRHGEEGCMFLANALAVFGGYENYDAIE